MNFKYFIKLLCKKLSINSLKLTLRRKKSFFFKTNNSQFLLFIFILKEILSEINKSNENLIDIVINNYNELKREKNLLLLNDIQSENNNLFFYEDFIFIFCCFIHYFTGLKIKIELTNDSSEDILFFARIYSVSAFLELFIKPFAL